jgi:hypothetical protein
MGKVTEERAPQLRSLKRGALGSALSCGSRRPPEASAHRVVGGAMGLTCSCLPEATGPALEGAVGVVLHHGPRVAPATNRAKLAEGTKPSLVSLPQGARKALRRRERRCYPPAAFTSAAHAFSPASPYGLLLARARFCRLSRHQLWWSFRMRIGG